MPLGSNHSDWAERFGECLFRISFYEGFEECSLANAWRPNDCNKPWRGFVGDSIDLRYMQTLLFDLGKSVKSSKADSIQTSCDRAAVFASRPGFAKPNAFGLWSRDCQRDGRRLMQSTNLQYASFSLWTAYGAYLLGPPC